MERRAHERYQARQYEDSNPIYGVYPYRILNISRAGCALESPSAFRVEPGPRGLEIPLHYRAAILRAEVELIWKNQRTDGRGRTVYGCGFRFGEMDEENRLALDDYVDCARQTTAFLRLEAAWDRVKKVQEDIGSLTRCEEMDERSRRELDRCMDLIRGDTAAARMERAWDTVRDIQDMIASLVAFGERTGTIKAH